MGCRINDKIAYRIVYMAHFVEMLNSGTGHMQENFNTFF
jgi:hypothetical protein